MTKEEYIAHLERLDSERCTHPFMKSLKRGYSTPNCVYLRVVLASQPAPAQSFELTLLYARKTRLFGERAKASNQMCELPDDAKHDHARADYSLKIQAIQREIATTMREIERHERGIYVPAQDVAMPADRASLIKKQLSLRASLSRARKSVKTGKPGATENVAKYQKELSDVENRLKNI
jgi:hypothetical protein